MSLNNQQIVNSVRTLHDLSKAINSTLNPVQVEELLLRKTAQLMRSDRVLILLLDTDKKSLLIHNVLGFAPSELPSAKFENISSFDHCIVNKGSVITLAEVLSPKDEKLLRSGFPHLLKMFFAPLEIQGLAYGLLGVAGRAQDFSRIELEIFCSLGSQAAVAMENAGLYTKLKETFLHTAEALAEAVNSRDPYTGGHTRRVRRYALQLADAIDLNEQETDGLQLAAILHDIGKIGIDDAILRKSNRLTDEEQQRMREHPRIGVRIIGHIEEMQNVIPGVLHHHEWYDGSGYPAGLTGERIPLQARIIAIVDAFDALTTDRPYRPASSSEEALDLLELHSGSHFDPHLLGIFRSLQSLSKL